MPYQPENWPDEVQDEYDEGYKQGYLDSKEGNPSDPPYPYRGGLVLSNPRAAVHYGYLDGYEDEQDGLELPDHLRDEADEYENDEEEINEESDEEENDNEDC